MLDDLKRQEAHYEEQLLMTRGAIQAVEHLLSQDDNEPKEGNENGETSKS